MMKSGGLFSCGFGDCLFWTVAGLALGAALAVGTRYALNRSSSGRSRMLPPETRRVQFPRKETV